MKTTLSRDYKNYDYLIITIKKDKINEVLKFYDSFLWKIEQNSEDKQYDDILHVTLKREHKIANKDRLQLLQVYMEAALNRIAAVEKNKHSFVTIWGIVSGLLFSAIITAGILLPVFFPLPLIITAGALLSLCGAVGGAFSAIKLKKKFIIEEEKSKSAVDGLSLNIKALCNEARKLTETEYGK